MDQFWFRLLVLLLPVVSGMAILVWVYYRARRKARGLRSELSQQRRDALRSVKLMIQQMEYDTEVLRLMRHARASKERRNETDFNAAIDELVRREKGMMERVDRASEFEGYLQKTYDPKKAPVAERTVAVPPVDGAVGLRSEPACADGTGLAPSPDQLKEDIRRFTRDLERIRAGELELLDEKIAFFENWVEGPDRREMLEGLRATALFLERGDASGLERLKNAGKKRQTRPNGRDKGKPPTTID